MWLHTDKGNKLRAVIQEWDGKGRYKNGCVLVTVAKDPFPVYVDKEKLAKVGGMKMPVKTATKASPVTRTNIATLRKQAEEAGIETEGLGVAALKEAIAAVNEAEPEGAVKRGRGRPKKVVVPVKTAKASPAKKAAVKRAASDEGSGAILVKAAEIAPEFTVGEFEFREGSNMAAVAAALMEGGTIAEISKAAFPKFNARPRPAIIERLGSSKAAKQEMIESTVKKLGRMFEAAGLVTKEGRGEELTFTPAVAKPKRRVRKTA